MNLNTKQIYYISFSLVLTYTLFGICKMGSVGGPCNAGIAIIVLFPAIFIVAIMQVSSFNLWLKGNGNGIGSCVLSLIGILIWCGAIMMFMDENAIKNLIYLSPFLLLNIATLVISVSKAPSAPAREKQTDH